MKRTVKKRRRRERPSEPPLESAPKTAGGVRERARRLLAIVDRDISLLEEPRGKSQLTELERYRITQSLCSMVTQLAKITGEGADMPDSKLVKLPGFQRIIERLAKALKRWPDAMRAVAGELDAIEGVAS